MSKSEPYIVKCDDGSLLMEWIGEDWRFVLSVENVPELESSWHLVHRQFSGGSGYIKRDFFDSLLQHLYETGFLSMWIKVNSLTCILSEDIDE